MDLDGPSFTQGSSSSGQEPTANRDQPFYSPPGPAFDDHFMYDDALATTTTVNFRDGFPVPIQGHHHQLGMDLSFREDLRAAAALRSSQNTGTDHRLGPQHPLRSYHQAQLQHNAQALRSLVGGAPDSGRSQGGGFLDGPSANEAAYSAAGANTKSHHVRGHTHEQHANLHPFLPTTPSPSTAPSTSKRHDPMIASSVGGLYRTQHAMSSIPMSNNDLLATNPTAHTHQHQHQHSHLHSHPHQQQPHSHSHPHSQPPSRPHSAIGHESFRGQNLHQQPHLHHLRHQQQQNELPFQGYAQSLRYQQRDPAPPPVQGLATHDLDLNLDLDIDIDMDPSGLFGPHPFGSQGSAQSFEQHDDPRTFSSQQQRRLHPPQQRGPQTGISHLYQSQLYPSAAHQQQQQHGYPQQQHRQPHSNPHHRMSDPSGLASSSSSSSSPHIGYPRHPNVAVSALSAPHSGSLSGGSEYGSGSLSGGSGSAPNSASLTQIQMQGQGRTSSPSLLSSAGASRGSGSGGGGGGGGGTGSNGSSRANSASASTTSSKRSWVDEDERIGGREGGGGGGAAGDSAASSPLSEVSTLEGGDSRPTSRSETTKVKTKAESKGRGGKRRKRFDPDEDDAEWEEDEDEGGGGGTTVKKGGKSSKAGGSRSGSTRGKAAAADAEEDEDEDSPSLKKKKKSKMHTCEICQKKFPRPSGLKTHMNTHSNAKPFPCGYPGCNRTFGVRSNAKRHLRTHGVIPEAEPPAAEPPYVVDFSTPVVMPALHQHGLSMPLGMDAADPSLDGQGQGLRGGELFLDSELVDGGGSMDGGGMGGMGGNERGPQALIAPHTQGGSNPSSRPATFKLRWMPPSLTSRTNAALLMDAIESGGARTHLPIQMEGSNSGIAGPLGLFGAGGVGDHDGGLEPHRIVPMLRRSRRSTKMVEAVEADDDEGEVGVVVKEEEEYYAREPNAIANLASMPPPPLLVPSGPSALSRPGLSVLQGCTCTPPCYSSSSSGSGSGSGSGSSSSIVCRRSSASATSTSASSIVAADPITTDISMRTDARMRSSPQPADGSVDMIVGPGS